MRRFVGIASLGAAILHAGLAPAHFEEWWGYGVFFLVAAACQGVYGLALVTRAFGDAPEDARWWRRTYLAGFLGTLFLLGLYAWSRAVGVPWLGPAAGQPEPVAPIDLFTKGLEVLVVAGSALLWRRALESVS